MTKQQAPAIFKNEEMKAMFSTPTVVENFQQGDVGKYEAVLKEKSVLKIFLNKNIVKTVLSFLNSGCNISQSVDGIFVHRNTVIYRLKIVKDRLGLDVKKFADAVVFVNILFLYGKLGIVKN